MARRYSRVSNYSIGQTVRALVFFLIVFGGSMWILPRTRWMLTPQQSLIVSFIFGAVAAAFARRYT
jgi:hypothetical protein